MSKEVDKLRDALRARFGAEADITEPFKVENPAPYEQRKTAYWHLRINYSKHVYSRHYAPTKALLLSTVRTIVDCKEEQKVSA